ncbi:MULTISPECIES: hypothetical protein [unclassified Sphingomonas]|uniref:hypothetical protein n=1 Tax=unclassified Sphingomonas TaxID=196159 RepID=UPI0035A824A3
MSNSVSSTHIAPLSHRQIAISTLLGIALWFLAAIILRAVGPMGALDGTARAITFALIFPGTVPFVYLLRWAAQLVGDQLLMGIAIGTMAAAFCDGIALSWLPSLYGEGVAQLAGSGATILWGIGVVLLLALIIGRRGAK